MLVLAFVYLKSSKLERMYVNLRRLLYNIKVLLGFIILLSACATPIAPTGGPPDRTGPKIVKTTPATGTVNFDKRTFTIEFDEYLNRANFAREVSIEPDLGIGYSIEWKRKTVTIKFEQSFPDSTTVILTLGSGVTDTRSNKMGSPTQIAVSTGPEIDEGKISGRIRNAETGAGFEGLSVFLYKSPFDLGQKADYKAISDTGGVFRFQYLSGGNYKAFALEDVNRNRVWNKNFENAQPFNKEYVQLDKSDSVSLDVLYFAKGDTLSPRVQGVGLFSTQRLRIRFSEYILVNQNSQISVQDSLGNYFSNAFPLFIPPNEGFALFAQSEEPLLENMNYGIDIQNITDLSGNEVQKYTSTFLGSAQEDTTTQRLIGSQGELRLTQNQTATFVYAAPIAEGSIIDSLVVVEGELSFEDWPNVEVDRNLLKISPQGEWISGVDYQFLLWNPITNRRSIVRPEIWSDIDYGSIEIEVEGDSISTFRYSIFDEEGLIQKDSSFTNPTEILNLPPISYTILVFKDENENGIWDFGAVDPYVKPEPYFIQSDVRVQRGFASQILIKL